jgi:two-component system nitrate/nitrite response regulator NarL
MRLVICDGNRIFGEALAAALQVHDPAVTALVTTTAADCIAAATRHQPQVCMVDLLLPEAEDGLEVVREVRDRRPDVAVVVVSDSSNAEVRERARSLGIAGFLGKNHSVSQLADALQKIVRGQPIFDPVPSPAASGQVAPFELTRREAEVLRRISAGQHTRQMAREMGIAVSTLRTYVKNVFVKLGVHSRLEAAAVVASQANLLYEISDPVDVSGDHRTALDRS